MRRNCEVRHAYGIVPVHTLYMHIYLIQNRPFTWPFSSYGQVQLYILFFLCHALVLEYFKYKSTVIFFLQSYEGDILNSIKVHLSAFVPKYFIEMLLKLNVK